MTHLAWYRQSELELMRTQNLLRLLPRGRSTVLNIGARDGHFSQLLGEYYDSVTTLDLRQPEFSNKGAKALIGDVTNLRFPDNSFDCVFCANVLEHVRDVQAACREISRVARYEMVIGVNYKEDTRVGRTTCRACGLANPPNGHINTFDEETLTTLFPGMTPVAKSVIGTDTSFTNQISAFLMDLAGNPKGTYQQREPCVHCGRKLVPPVYPAPWWSRACSALAEKAARMQAMFKKPHGRWIHLVLRKEEFPHHSRARSAA